MFRTSIATPCPAPYTSSSLPIPAQGRRFSSTSLGSVQDDTAEIDYTRAIQVEFKNAKPRRKSTFQRKEKREAAITIFEDVVEDEELVVENRREPGRSTLLGKPAQRNPARVVPKLQDTQKEAEQPLRAIGQARKTSSIAPDRTIHEEGFEAEANVAHRNVAPKGLHGGLKKDPRRRTIFVPTDGTTIMTIHPGAHNTNRLNDTFHLSNFAVQSLVVQENNKPIEEPQVQPPTRKTRMSLAAAPKRLPLQQVAAQASNVPGADVAGKNGGKENMPPLPVDVFNVEKPKSAVSRLFEPTAASQARVSIVARKAGPLPKTCPNAPRPRPAASQPSLDTKTGPRTVQTVAKGESILAPLEPKHQASPGSDSALHDRKRNREKQHPKPIERKVARLQQYQFLCEDLAQPELYEDGWLAHQEVALTELINQIFCSADPKAEEWQQAKRSLREQLIDIYHKPRVTTLHKRLQASLLYGALSRPRDLPGTPNPSQDIGLRKRFLSLWLDSYTHETLCAAAEVVFGRQLPRLSPSLGDGFGASESALDPHKGRRTLIAFLETFLVELEDVENLDEERGGDPNGRWRKMILRSLMLIWLLDQAKVSATVEGCLFRPSSPRKNSVTMLHTLATMLIPSIGDVSRVLRHFDFDVSHNQDPLDEVTYRIENMAVDLRDGILLTRLVELLLFAPKSIQAAETTGDATVTIRMPDFTILESELYDVGGARSPHILSEHLKMPCLGRSQKMFNVQVATSALHDHGRLADGASDVTAEDIVDGHREKTLSLLWSLVSTHGLGQLIDFKELTADIKRAAGITIDVDGLPEDHSRLSQLQQESLIKKWASAHCTRNGTRINNLTTSFADGKAYSTMLDAFAEYIPTKRSHRSGPLASDTARLGKHLQTFGCSNAFIKQLTSTWGTIPSRKTTISNLAFLASRLLPLARRYNAALTIQRTVRLKRYRIVASRRVVLVRLAYACAHVVETQSRLVSATTVLQRCWRRVLDVRITRLNRDVETFQSAARSWTLRRKIQRGRSARSGSQSLRVMGGW